MIKAIILDIDGVIVGEKIGFNFPHPNSEVLMRMQKVRESGIPIILCTAKPSFSITDIVIDSHLNNPHITDGGAIIIDPLDNLIVEKLTIEDGLAKTILQELLTRNIYTEFYTAEDYFIQKNEVGEITKIHEDILQRKAKILESLVDESSKFDITKIMLFSRDVEDKEKISKLLEPFDQLASINWGLHPTALPRQIGFIVNKKTSKKDAVIKALESLNISLDDTLGIGDSTSDWKFIGLCNYAATLENGTEELKVLVKSKPNSFIGKSVDENGLLDIFDHFNLLS